MLGLVLSGTYNFDFNFGHTIRFFILPVVELIEGRTYVLDDGVAVPLDEIDNREDTDCAALGIPSDSEVTSDLKGELELQLRLRLARLADRVDPNLPLREVE